MALKLENPQKSIDEFVNFIRTTFATQKKSQAVIAVSGGIDSALALALLVKALGSAAVTAVLLPYGKQSVADSLLITEHLGLSSDQVKQINIQPLVDVAAKTLGLTEADHFRLGNLQARARMMCVYDLAKSQEALVCGTENKSEHYLGYFTRFGDAASDLEPISSLYKTQVRQLVEFLQLPAVFLNKAPSAGLWAGQTDEEEMGFSYEQADRVLEQLIDLQKPASEITLPGISNVLVKKVTNQVQAMSFKLQVPYQFFLVD